VKEKKERRKNEPELPAFCDFQCPHASFPPADAVGACRREQGVYCTLFKEFNNKNAACIGHAPLVPKGRHNANPG